MLLSKMQFLYRIVKIEALCLLVKSDAVLNEHDLSRLLELRKEINQLCLDAISGDETKLFLAK